MKVIFLDVDGVLNSEELFERCGEELVPVDEENVRCLREIIDATGAQIVLSSSWRYGWAKNSDEVQDWCKLLVDVLAKYQIEIIDKTAYSNTGRREDEIKDWLERCKEKVERFVILDDGNYEWHRHGYDKNLVKTNFNTGGLREKHVQKAVQILNKKSFWKFWK